MTKREKRIINELQLVTGVMTEDIQYLCFLLLKDGTYFNSTKTEKEKAEEEVKRSIEAKVESLQALTFDDLLKMT